MIIGEVVGIKSMYLVLRQYEETVHRCMRGHDWKTLAIQTSWQQKHANSPSSPLNSWRCSVTVMRLKARLWAAENITQRGPTGRVLAFFVLWSRGSCTGVYGGVHWEWSSFHWEMLSSYSSKYSYGCAIPPLPHHHVTGCNPIQLVSATQIPVQWHKTQCITHGLVACRARAHELATHSAPKAMWITIGHECAGGFYVCAKCKRVRG